MLNTSNQKLPKTRLSLNVSWRLLTSVDQHPIYTSIYKIMCMSAYRYVSPSAYNLLSPNCSLSHSPPIFVCDFRCRRTGFFSSTYFKHSNSNNNNKKALKTHSCDSFFSAGISLFSLSLRIHIMEFNLIPFERGTHEICFIPIIENIQ